MKTVAAFCSIGLFLGGCSNMGVLYGNADQSASKSEATIVAVSTHDHPILGGLDHSVFIGGIDDQNFGGLNNYDRRFASLSSYPEKIKVQPGLHSMIVFYQRLNYRVMGCLWIRAKPAKIYLIEAHPDEASVKFSLKEQETGAIVGGNCDTAPDQ